MKIDVLARHKVCVTKDGLRCTRACPFFCVEPYYGPRYVWCELDLRREFLSGMRRTEFCRQCEAAAKESK